MKQLVIALGLLATMTGAATAAPAPPPPTAATVIPLDDKGFTAYVLAKIGAMQPSLKAHVSEPLAIELPDYTIGLDRMQSACRNMPDRCDEMVTDFLVKSISLAQSGPAKADLTLLRAAVRPSDYADAMARAMQQTPEHPQLLQRPFAGGLVEICLLDNPTSARLISLKDAGDLQLTADATFAACEANIAKTENLGDAKDLAEGEADFLTGDFYFSSLALLHDAWKPIAQKFGGQLIIAVPGPDGILYGRGEGAALITRLRNGTAMAMRMTDRPLSADLLQWTETGWSVVPP
jgi:hypothetical protein